MMGSSTEKLVHVFGKDLTDVPSGIIDKLLDEYWIETHGLQVDWTGQEYLDYINSFKQINFTGFTHRETGEVYTLAFSPHDICYVIVDGRAYANHRIVKQRERLNKRQAL